MFAVLECGYRPRSALEVVDTGEIRLQKIERLIEASEFGIHDLSNMKLDADSGLPRFNMPLELGLFLGAKRFGDETQKRKRCLVLDLEPFRYQRAISDISGQDIKSHRGEPGEAIRCVRGFLSTVSRRKTLPGGSVIAARYDQYAADLPAIARGLRLDVSDLDFNDVWKTMLAWQKVNA